MLVSCKKDNVDPSINALEINEFDLIQVTEGQPFVPVRIQAQDNRGISSIEITITKENETEPVAKNSLKNIITNSIRNLVINVDFPTNNIAPKGFYIISYTVTDRSGKKNTVSYKVFIQNNYAPFSTAPCTFPANIINAPLAEGKNVRLFIVTPSSTNGEDIYISGNFEGSVSGCSGNWTGGGCPSLKPIKLQGSNTCYYLDIKLDNNSEFKVTRGSWGSVMKKANGDEVPNLIWNRKNRQVIYVEKWADRSGTLTPPAPGDPVLPFEAIKPGMATVVLNVGSIDDNADYYFIPRNSTDPSKAIKAFPVELTTRIAAPIPKQAGQYEVIKTPKTGNIVFTNKAVTSEPPNPNIFVLTMTDNKQVNIINANAIGFISDFMPNDLYVTGSGVPSGWTNTPPASQRFTNKGNGIFELPSVNIIPNAQIKFLPVHGQWNPQFSVGTADPGNLTGSIIRADATPIPTPAVGGAYKIEVNFVTYRYTFT
ncbi:MAG: hypothetical protein NZ519_01900, partial [Bacteroidia bacterium]|nr:hypothetical protein [Bacteroidia bacterium]